MSHSKYLHYFLNLQFGVKIQSAEEVKAQRSPQNWQVLKEKKVKGGGRNGDSDGTDRHKSGV